MSDISDIIGDVDLSEVKGQSYDVMPAGWYMAEISKAEVRDTKDKTGKYLFVEFDVLTEPFNGRKLFQRYNIRNKSQQAVDIGMRELAGLGSALGLVRIADTTDIIGKFLQVRAVVTTDKNTGENGNTIKGYKSGDASSAPEQKPAPTKSAPATQSTAKPAAAKRPWEK